MGIAAIYQELTIIPEMSVPSNAFLGKVPNRFFFTDKRRMERRFAELSRWMGLNISPHVNAGTLSIANQQMIEIRGRCRPTRTCSSWTSRRRRWLRTSARDYTA